MRWPTTARPTRRGPTSSPSASGVPALPPLAVDGTLGERATASANFRDEYYGLAPAVDDRRQRAAARHQRADRPRRARTGVSARPGTPVDPCSGPPSTSPRCRPPMRRWVERLLVPKVLVANQTRVIEAVVDPDGAWLPAVPVVTVVPRPGVAVDDIAAVLTSPVASRCGRGTGRPGPACRRARCASVRAADRGAALAGGCARPGRGRAFAPATSPAAVRAVDAAYGVTSSELDVVVAGGAARVGDHGDGHNRASRARCETRRRDPSQSSRPVVRRGAGARVPRAAGETTAAAMPVPRRPPPRRGGGGVDAAAVQRGEQLAKDRWLPACHKVEGAGIGPTWVGLYGSTVTLDDGTTVVVDDAYLHRSIEDPSAQKAERVRRWRCRRSPSTPTRSPTSSPTSARSAHRPERSPRPARRPAPRPLRVRWGAPRRRACRERASLRASEPMSRTRVIVAALGAAVTVLAACGGGGSHEFVGLTRVTPSRWSTWPRCPTSATAASRSRSGPSPAICSSCTSATPTAPTSARPR